MRNKRETDISNYTDKTTDAASASEKKAALDLLKKRAEERKVRLDDEAEEEADD